MLCFLVFSDSAYRNKIAKFLADHFRAHVHVTIDPEESIGTEELFIRLDGGAPNDPSQLFGLEDWPEGLDNLLGRLNLRREALAERCRRPVLVWTLSTQVNTIIMRAADLWGVAHRHLRVRSAERPAAWPDACLFAVLFAG